MGRSMKPFPSPRPLFPIAGPIRGPLEMIPAVADPTGRGARAWSILARLPITEGEHSGKLIGENAPPWQERLTRPTSATSTAKVAASSARCSPASRRRTEKRRSPRRWP